MGAKISIDSATLVNKALELIEAAWLFSMNEEKIGIVIHPESIVHSLVTFKDRTQFAHMSVPDMRGALGFGMTYPEQRLPQLMAPLALDGIGTLTFESLDDRRFPAPSLARSCLRTGGAAPAVFNSANECAVARFMKGKIRFTDIVPAIERALTRFSGSQCNSVDTLLQLHREIELFFGMAA
jgi:1-deoxy-D-xylulose-5-phosphate reductoisomerase